MVHRAVGSRQVGHTEELQQVTSPEPRQVPPDVLGGVAPQQPETEEVEQVGRLAQRVPVQPVMPILPEVVAEGVEEMAPVADRLGVRRNEPDVQREPVAQGDLHAPSKLKRLFLGARVDRVQVRVGQSEGQESWSSLL